MRVYDTDGQEQLQTDDIYESDDANYIKYNNGVMVQWATTVSNDGNETIVFPEAFSEAPVVTTCCPRSSYYTTCGGNGTPPTSTQFIFYSRKWGDSSAPGDTTNLHWVAIGKWN